MANPKANQSKKQDHENNFNLDRERARITIMKFFLALLCTVLILLLIISLITNQ